MKSPGGPAMPSELCFSIHCSSINWGIFGKIEVEIGGDGICLIDDGGGHAVERCVNGHSYFGKGRMPNVLAHVIGLSLFSAFCEELTIEARRQDRVASSRFKDAFHLESEARENRTGETGNVIRFRFSQGKLKESISVEEIEQYLRSVKAAHPALELTLDGGKAGSREACPAPIRRHQRDRARLSAFAGSSNCIRQVRAGRNSRSIGNGPVERIGQTFLR